MYGHTCLYVGHEYTYYMHILSIHVCMYACMHVYAYILNQCIHLALNIGRHT